MARLGRAYAVQVRVAGPVAAAVGGGPSAFDAHADAASGAAAGLTLSLAGSGHADAATGAAGALGVVKALAGHADAAGGAAGVFVPSSPFPAAITSRRIVDQYGHVYLMRTLQSWSLAMNTNSNADVTTALTDAKNLGFNAVTVWAGGGFAPAGFSGWNRYTNKQGHAYWTGTPWASTFGAAWGDLDWVVSECLRLGLTLNLSFCGGAGSNGARADWVAVTNAQMQTVGTTIANRYPVASNPHIVWHVMWDDPSDSTAQARINNLFLGINGVEGGTARLRWEEPWKSVVSSWSQDGAGGTMGNFVTATWMNGWYSWNDTATTDAEASRADTGATTRAYGAVEPNYNQNPPNTVHQLRATTWSGFLEGAAYMAYGDMDWYPFEAESEVGGLGLGNWVNVPGYTPSVQQSYIFPVVDAYVSDAGWAPTSSFVTTGEGTAGNKAAIGASTVAALAYFPNSRTVVVDTTILTGVPGQVRLRWFDPTAGTYSTISAGEAKTAGRSVTIPAAHSDTYQDYVLVVDARSTAVALDGHADAASGAAAALARARPTDAHGDATSGAAAALAAARPVDAHADATSGAAGTLSVTRPLAAHADAATDAPAALGAARPLAAHADATSGAAALFGLPRVLAGHADTTSGAAAGLGAARPLAGHADAADGATASFTAGGGFDAHVDATSGAAGALSLNLAASGHSDAASGAAGTLGVLRSIDAHSDASDGAAGLFGLPRVLAGHADVAAGFAALVDVTADRLLDGPLSGATGAAATLSTGRRLDGSAGATAGSAGTLAAVRDLAGRAEIAVGAVALVGNAQPLAAVGAVAVTATAVLTVALPIDIPPDLVPMWSRREARLITRRDRR